MDDWVRWALGAFAALFVGWNGYLHTRISEQAKDADDKNQRLSDALEKHKAEYQEFRGQSLRDMVTKQDLRDAEQRILAALQARAA